MRPSYAEESGEYLQTFSVCLSVFLTFSVSEMPKERIFTCDNEMRNNSENDWTLL